MMKKRFIGGLSVFMVIIAVVFFMPARQVRAEEDINIMDYVEGMEPGWNLGNTLEATGAETSWGNPLTTKELIDKLAEEGYKSIRIPITWKHRSGAAPDYIIDESFLKRVQEIVDWSLDADMYVIINLHHDTEWLLPMESDPDGVKEHFNAYWVQISDYFKDYPSKLVFESFNEPRFSDNWSENKQIYFDMLDDLNVSFYHIVRDSGSNNATRPLAISTICASAEQIRLDETAKTIIKLKDKNLIATTHFYGQYHFSVNLAGYTKFDETVQKDMIDMFDRLDKTFLQKGIPVFIGEFGLLGYDKSLDVVEHGEAHKFFELFTFLAKEKKIPSMLWDNGRHLNRNTLEWGDQSLFDVMKLGLTARSSSSEFDTIFIHEGDDIIDTKMQMNLNGNTLSSILYGEETMVLGTDYSMVGEILTLKKSFLDKVITKTYGRNATLIFKFSAGADWTMDLVYYGTAKLKSVSSNISLMIPLVFQGDRLATMEAVYPDGTNAGPQNWTSYKEYGYCYQPNYEKLNINLTSDFFNECKDGDIVLKFHFWSGQVVEYNIKKDGIELTGVSNQEYTKEEYQMEKNGYVKSDVVVENTTEDEKLDKTETEQETDLEVAQEITPKVPKEEDVVTSTEAMNGKESNSKVKLIIIICILVVVMVGIVTLGVIKYKKGKNTNEIK